MFADFKTRGQNDGLVWTIKIPLNSCLNYWMSFIIIIIIKYIFIYFSTLLLCFTFASYMKKPSFSNLISLVLALI